MNIRYYKCPERLTRFFKIYCWAEASFPLFLEGDPLKLDDCVIMVHRTTKYYHISQTKMATEYYASLRFIFVIHTVKGFGIVNKAETEIYSLRVLEVRSKSWRYLQDPLGAPRENHSLSFQLAADSLWFMAPSLQSLPSPLATSFLCLYVFYSSVCVCPQTLASLL